MTDETTTALAAVKAQFAANAAAKAPKPFSSYDDCKNAIAALAEGDTEGGAECARRIGASCFQPVEQHTLSVAIVKRTGLPKGIVTAEIKEGKKAAQKAEAASATSFDVRAWNVHTRFIANGQAVIARIDGVKVTYHQVASYEKLMAEHYDEDPETGRHTPHTSLWITDPTAAKYCGRGFWPNRPDAYDADPEKFIAERAEGIEHEWNDFRGWNIPRSADPIERDKCKLIRRHHFKVLCNGSLEYYRDNTMLEAWRLQTCGDVSKRVPIATVCPSENEGIGKSLFYDKIIGEAYQPYKLTLSQGEQLTGQFNLALSTCCYLISEEALYGPDPRNSGPIKQLVSGESLRVRPLYCESYEAPNYANLVFLANPANDEKPVPINDKSRRYFILPSYDVAIPSKEHFDAILAEMKAGGVAAHADYLWRWQPTRAEFDFMLAEAREWHAEDTEDPLTVPDGWAKQPEDWSRLSQIGREGEARDRMLAGHLPTFTQFLLRWIGGSYTPPADAPQYSGSGGRYTASELAKAYAAFLADMPHRVRDRATLPTPEAVGYALKNVFGDAFTKTHTRDGEAWIIPARDEAVRRLGERSSAFRVFLSQGVVTDSAAPSGVSSAEVVISIPTNGTVEDAREAAAAVAAGVAEALVAEWRAQRFLGEDARVSAQRHKSVGYLPDDDVRV